MTYSEFIFSSNNNILCNFTFQDGKIAKGVITTFLIEDPNTLYLLKANLIQEYKKLEEAKDMEGIKNLLVPINPEAILSAELVEDISNPFRNA